MAAISGMFLILNMFWSGLAFAIIMFVGDALDGATARAKGSDSKFGTVFDHVVDRYAEIFIVSSLMIGKSVSPPLAVFCLTGMIMASYVRAKAESAGGLIDCSVGIAGRAEKLFLIYGAIISLALSFTRVSDYLLGTVGLISHITAIQRLIYARKSIE
jgi:CDP-diacylglycerol--glycerol-3-phosphate 3-phosphatidyltransferase/archaetidylinositol phosphate synthase